MSVPALFVSHGAPSLVLEPSPSHRFFEGLSELTGRPQAIVCITAHWETPQVAVSLAASPSMIYDFFGFPEELYNVRYPAPGRPALARRVLALLGNAGIEAVGDATRGFDHGVWSPLALMYPQADIPVVPLSVQPHRAARHHFQVGAALRPLRDEGVLILASGSMTHNLRELGTRTPEHAREFEVWVCEALEDGRLEDLLEWETRAPFASRNHPTPEHFLPLFVALGAAAGKGSVLNRRFEYGSLSMGACIWNEVRRPPALPKEATNR